MPCVHPFGRIVPVVMCRPVAVGHLPPIVGRCRAVTDDAVVCVAGAGIKPDVASHAALLLVGAVRQGYHVAVGIPVHHLLAAEQVYLRLFLAAVSRHAPSRVECNTRDVYIPAHAKPSVAASTAVCQCQVGLHAVTACRHPDGIAQVGSALAVGCRGLYQREAVKWIHRLEVGHHRGYKRLCLRHLGCLDKFVYEVGEMGGQRHNLAVCRIHFHTFQTHPCHSGGIVKGCVDVVDGVTLRQQVGIVCHPQFRRRAEMLARGQKPVARRLCCHVFHAFRQRWQFIIQKDGDTVVATSFHCPAQRGQAHALGLDMQGVAFQHMHHLVGNTCAAR